MRIYLFILAFFVSIASAAVQPEAALITPTDPVRTTEQQNARRAALQQERDSIASSRQELENQLNNLAHQLESLPPKQITEALVEQAEVDLQAARLRLEGSLTEQQNAERRINELGKGIIELESREQLLKNPVADPLSSKADRAEQLQRTQQRLAQQRIDLELETLNLSNLREQIELGKMRVKFADLWHEQVGRAYRLIQEQTRLDTQVELVTRLQNDQTSLQDRAHALKQRLAQERGTMSLAAWQRLEAELRIVDERVNLLNIDRQLAESASVVARLQDTLHNSSASIEQLRQSVQLVEGLQGKLERDEELLQQRLSLYEQQRQLIERRDRLVGTERRLRDEELQMVVQLIADINQRLSQAQDYLLQVRSINAQLSTIYQERLHEELFTRRFLPTTSEGWNELWQGLAAAPSTLFHQIRLSIEAVPKALWEAQPWRLVLLLAAQSAVIWLVIIARRNLQRAARYLGAQCAGDSFVRQLLRTLVALARKMLSWTGATIGLLLLLWISNVPHPGFGILITLALVCLGVRLAISLAWLLLAAPTLPAKRQQIGVYRLLVWVLSGCGFFISLVSLGHLSDLPNTVLSAFDRVFMLYWFLVLLPILRIRWSLVERLAEHYGERFWFSMLRFGSFLFPLSLMGTALLGVIGYRRLAWLLAGGLMIFITIFGLWLLARSLLNDLIVALKNFAVTHSGYGLLWTQDVITPLHRIANLLLFLAACMALFRTYGWSGDSEVVVTFWQIVERPLLNIGGAHITLWRIITTCTLLAMVIWLGQWIRAISYRWILSHINDMGVRHSLSVFTQYTVVLIGFLAILQLVGIDLTALAVFAGAVGVGIGLGMQSLANNFISGLLLLVERPLRSGDIVQVGTHLGEVTNIGMRALIVKTFDNESVIIPNADVISNAFINWTHDDQIHRIISWVAISYDADIHLAQQIMNQVLIEHDAVLDEPEYLVLLWSFADASVRFRVQYYIDLHKSKLLKTQHEVLLEIWDKFKAAGIRLPYPQRYLYLDEQ